jgi:hypothetical protein
VIGQEWKEFKWMERTARDIRTEAGRQAQRTMTWLGRERGREGWRRGEESDERVRMSARARVRSGWKQERNVSENVREREGNRGLFEIGIEVCRDDEQETDIVKKMMIV